MTKNERPRAQSTSEFLTRLAADPDYQAQKRAFEIQHRARQEALALAEAPVVEALRQGGLSVSSVSNLVNTSAKYTSSLPILLEHLQRDYPEPILDSIARAIAVPEAKFAWKTLLRLFRHRFEPEPNGVKWAIGAALAAAADEEVMPDLIQLVGEKRHGVNRVVFVQKLARSRLANARAALEAAIRDPDLEREVRRVLKKESRRTRRKRT